MEGWKIQRDRTKCVEPGCTLASAQEYFAVLELPECVRRDVCATCFHKIERAHAADGSAKAGAEAATKPAPVFWKCRRKTSKDDGPVLDLTALRMLFDRLGEISVGADGVDDEAAERAAGLRYFVSLLLLRKRVLKMVDPQNEAQERADLVVVDPKVPGMAPVCLVAPALDAARLENLEAELLEALGSGGDESDDAGESGGGDAGGTGSAVAGASS